MAKRPHHVIVRKITEEHYTVEAINRYDASFQAATGIADGTLQPERVVVTKTTSHVSAEVDED